MQQRATARRPRNARSALRNHVACSVQSAGMHGESVPEAAVWLGMVGAYAWSVRSLARLGWEHDGDCPAEASDHVGAHRLRVAGSTPSVENPPAVAPVAVARPRETRIADLLTAELWCPRSKQADVTT